MIGIAGLKAGQSDHLKQIVNLVGDLGLWQLPDLQAERDVVAHRQMLESRVVLEDEADSASLRRHAGDIDTVDGDGAGVRGVQAGDRT